MSEQKHDGGPAFPPQDRILVTPHITHEQMKVLQDTLAHAQQTGMSLRDYFAASALSLVQGSVLTACAAEDGPMNDSIAKMVYELADSMLKARAQ